MEQLKKVLPVQSGYFLEDDGYDGFLSVIIPEKRDNYVGNPVLFDSTNAGSPTGFSAAGPVVVTKIAGGPFWLHYWSYAFTAVGQFVTTNSSYAPMTGHMTVSMWLRSSNPADIKIRLQFTDSGGSQSYTSTPKRVTNVWTQFSYTVPIDGSVSTVVSIQLRPDQISTIEYGACQLEEGDQPTTLIHGYAGKGYSWLGTPFVAGARREETVIDGGRIVNLKKLGMRLTSIDGLGIPDSDHQTTDLAFSYGSKFNGLSFKDRDYDMEFTLYSLSLNDLLCARNSVGRAIFNLNQAVTFLWQPLNCGLPICDAVKFQAVYKGGFSLGLNSHYGEEVKLNFTGYDIAMKSMTTESQQLSTSTSLVHQAIIGVDKYGNLNALAPVTAIASTIHRCHGMVVSPYDGLLYAIYEDGSVEASARGVVLRYDGLSWTKIAQGSTASGGFLAIHANAQYIYVSIKNRQSVTGQSGFTGTSGLGLARINLASRTVDDIGSLLVGTTLAKDGVTALQPAIHAFATNLRGDLYIGGNFRGITSTAGTLNRYHMAVFYKSLAWISLAQDLQFNNGRVLALYYDKDTKRLYAGGDFEAPGFIRNPLYRHVFFYTDVRTDGQGISVLTDFPLDMATAGGVVTSITKYKNRIVIGGQFRSNYAFDLGLLDNLAYYDPDRTDMVGIKGTLMPFNGRFTGLGIEDTFADSMGDSEVNPVESLVACGDTLYIAGKMQYYGQRTSIVTFEQLGEVCGTVKYNSTAKNGEFGVFSPDIAFDYGSMTAYTNCYVLNVACGSPKLEIERFYSSWMVTNIIPNLTTYSPVPTDIEICATDLPVSPKFLLIGPGKITEIANQTYGLSIFFDYTIQANEIVFVDLSVTPAKITSSFLGDITYKMLPSSTPGAFKLFPGTNSIVVKATWNTTSSATLFAVLYERNALAAEALCCDCPE